ncbi:hypothetical protein E2C01_060831 [Portunus trituberculatus]|uniref:Uncharacterized protein n=1 Tax=Portunus trituberculatus TaxID=210409 RepID=A0A5B7H3M6_PORTR|nr:hypothetical protein [Portunus trituberculatus]
MQFASNDIAVSKPNEGYSSMCPGRNNMVSGLGSNMTMVKDTVTE